LASGLVGLTLSCGGSDKESKVVEESFNVVPYGVTSAFSDYSSRFVMFGKPVGFENTDSYTLPQMVKFEARGLLLVKEAEALVLSEMNDEDDDQEQNFDGQYVRITGAYTGYGTFELSRLSANGHTINFK
jgi:hypothetical protein